MRTTTWLCLLLGIASMASAQAAQLSSNWSGYVAAPSAALGSHFSGVSGTWTEPSVACAKGHVSYSAVWVGLGGSRENASALEQVGTDADCTHSGHAVYSSWFELLPAEAMGTRLAVHPGDQITASVTVRGHSATLRLRDLSTGKRFTLTRHLAAMDISSAEWIVEAPSICSDSGPCKTKALTDFGQVAFSTTSATAHGHTGPIADPGWSVTALELRQSFTTPHGHRGAKAVGTPSNNVIVAAPSSAANAQGAFAVRWQEQAVQGERSTPPRLPGAATTPG
jgi:Peptidase A4 family